MTPTRLRDRAWYPPVSGLLYGVAWALAGGVIYRWPWWVVLLTGTMLFLLGWWTEGLRRDRRLRGLDEREMGMYSPASGLAPKREQRATLSA